MAISQVLAIVVVIAVVAFALGGYFVVTLAHLPQVTTYTTVSVPISTQASLSSTSSIFFNGSTSQLTVYLLTCSVTTYQVWSVESISTSTTIGTTSTQTQSSSYTTATNASESVGYATTTTVSHTGTLTGALAYWQVQSCTYVK